MTAPSLVVRVFAFAVLVLLGQLGPDGRLRDARGDEHAPREGVRVLYALGAESCPSPEAVRASLAAHDVQHAQGTVRFARFGEFAFSAEIEAEGQTKLLTDVDCKKLLEPVTLALALIVPLASRPAAEVSPPPPPPASTANAHPAEHAAAYPASPSPPAHRASEPPERAVGGLHVGGRVAGGLSRNPVVGVAFGGWLRVWRSVSVGVTASFFASDAFAYRTGRVENDMWGVAANACTDLWTRERFRMAPCLGVSIMDFQTRGAFFADNRLGRFVRVAPEVAWLIAFEPLLGLSPGVRASLDIPLVRKSYDTLQGARAWLMPALSGSVTVQLDYRFR